MDANKTLTFEIPGCVELVLDGAPKFFLNAQRGGVRINPGSMKRTEPALPPTCGFGVAFISASSAFHLGIKFFSGN
jgi:hypothetical protein